MVVTGGTGFIGSHLVERLWEEGKRDILVPVRNYKTCAEIARFPIRMPRVNLLNDQEVRKTMEGARLVFHLAYGYDGPNPGRITVDGTKNVVNAAIDVGAECVVILSSMYVYGFPDTNQPVDETWPYRPFGGEYGRGKVKMECWCLARAKNSGRTRIIVLNPTCVYGPRGKTYTRLPIEMAKKGSFCWIEGGKGVANYTYIENLVDAILLAAANSEINGERFIVNDGYCTWREFLGPLLGEFLEKLPSWSHRELLNSNSCHKTRLKDLIRHLANDPEFICLINENPFLGNLKRFLLRKIPGLKMELVTIKNQNSIRTGQETDKLPLQPEWLDNLFGATQTVFSSEKIRRALGWKPKLNLEEGQSKTLCWMQEVRIL